MHSFAKTCHGRSCMPTSRCCVVQVFQELPMEFAAEVNQLMSLKLEGSVG